MCWVFSWEWSYPSSLCTSSAEVHSRVRQACFLNDQSPTDCALSLHRELLLKLTLIVQGAHIPIPNQGHRAGVCLMLVPKHYNQASVIVGAVY